MATGRNYRLLRVKVNPPMIVGAIASSFSRFDFPRFSFLLFAVLSPSSSTGRQFSLIGHPGTYP